MADPGHIAGPVYIPNVVAIRLFWQLPNSKQAFNVLHGHYTTTPSFSQSAVNALFTGVTTAYTASGLSDNQDVETQLVHLGIRDMRQGSDGFGFGEWVSDNSGVTGTGGPGGGPLPHQISFVVSLKTGRSGQANRGRVYIPGFHNSADDGNGFASVDTANHSVDFVNRVNTFVTAQGFPLTIAHPARAEYTGSTGTHHPARPAGDVLVTGVTFLDRQWDTQRLRNQL